MALYLGNSGGWRCSKGCCIFFFWLAFQASYGDTKSSMYPSGPPLPAIPISLKERLSVNLSNLERYVVRGASEEQGLLQIRELMINSRYEEMWAFLPQTDTYESTWYEIGRDVNETVDGMAIRVDRPFLRTLMNKYNHIHIYHFHPLAYFQRCRPAIDCGYPAVARETGQISRVDFIANMRYAMPSPEDIYFMMDLSWEFNRVRGNKGTLRHRVVTPYGVVDYALTAQGLARYKDDRSLRTGGLYIALLAGNALLDGAIAASMDKFPDNSELILQHIAQGLTNQYLTVRLLK